MLQASLASEQQAVPRLTSTILDVVSRVPASREPVSTDPAHRSAQIAKAVKRKSAAISAAAALPTGPLGWLTLLPEAMAIWRLQAQMVADIAAAHGRSHALTPEVMLHCLFRHSASKAVGGLVVRVGERLLVRRASLRALQPMARAVAMRMTQRTMARGLARWVPGVGSLAIGTYAWMDAGKVARTATEVFSRPVEVQPAPPGGAVL